MNKLLRYEPIIGTVKMDRLLDLVALAQNKSIKMINSTKVGGGVAEMLSRIVPLLNDIGIKTTWDVIDGDKEFFTITKKMHNALQGQECKFTGDEFVKYFTCNEDNWKKMRFEDDMIVIHDPQPAGLIFYIKERGILTNKWIWRCHIDMVAPNKLVWGFLKFYVDMYDKAIFTMKEYAPELNIPILQFFPAIDPFDDKNKKLSEDYIDSVFKKYAISRDKPIVTQVSRFDPWKDPVGVIESFKIAREMGADCRLLLIGDKASDDPESETILTQVKKAAGTDTDIFIRLIPTNPLEINAIQRGSTIIIQKSLREGFGLTITEALWKKKPVIATNVGGIPKQIIDTKTGILCAVENSIIETAKAIKTLLNSKWYGELLGKNGHEHVRENFLIIENVRRYLELLLEDV